MNKLLSLLSVVMLQGCMWQSVDSETLHYANKFCSEKDMKVYKISEWWSGSTDLICSPTGLREGENRNAGFDEYIRLQRKILIEKHLLEEGL